jgi:predicted amidohydrolase YtcJ
VKRGVVRRPFRDAHTHLTAGAADLLDLDLRQLRTPDDLSAAIARRARSLPAPSWIRGWGWDGASSPDDVAPSHPVFLSRRDGHAAWINPAGRAALELPGDEAVVREAAFDATRRLLPQRTTAERMAAVGPHLAELVEHNVGAVDDMIEAWAPEVYARLRDRRELPVSIGLWLPEDLPESEAAAVRREFPSDDPQVAVRGIKIFLDGTLGARTAALSSPYADDPGTSGALRVAEREIPERVARWAGKGWPVALHAIGDRAVTLALSALERAPRPRWGAHRIEHAQVVLRTDLSRFAPAGVVASLQPGHWSDDRPWLAGRLGSRPGVLVHPLSAFARSGATLVFGSDWPVSSWDPVTILTAATNRERGEQAFDAAEAAAWYTSSPRWPTKSSSKGSSSTGFTA